MLAEAVLGDATVQLALAVLDGGPFAQARATELAEGVLSAVGADEVAATIGEVAS